MTDNLTQTKEIIGYKTRVCFFFLIQLILYLRLRVSKQFHNNENKKRQRWEGEVPTKDNTLRKVCYGKRHSTRTAQIPAAQKEEQYKANY